ISAAALRNVEIDFPPANHAPVRRITGGPPARDMKFGSVPACLCQFAFPMSQRLELFFDGFQRFGEDTLQKAVDLLPAGFLRIPAVHCLRTAIPEADRSVVVQREN